MTTILRVASSSNLASSTTRQIGRLTVEGLLETHPGATVIERDLVKQPLPHLSPEFLGATFSGTDDAPVLALSNALLEELFAADTLVIEAPMYNFGIPSALKAWIDHVVRAGRTFQYTPNGPAGLATGKNAILILGRGGVYSEGPYQAMDYQESYLRAILGFIGITQVASVYIEGVAMGPEKREQALAGARDRAHSLTHAAA